MPTNSTAPTNASNTADDTISIVDLPTLATRTLRLGHEPEHMELDPTATGIYVIDFNGAYHPFCYYNAEYDCPFPPAENRLALAIRAGERLPESASAAR